MGFRWFTFSRASSEGGEPAGAFRPFRWARAGFDAKPSQAVQGGGSSPVCRRTVLSGTPLASVRVPAARHSPCGRWARPAGAGLLGGWGMGGGGGPAAVWGPVAAGQWGALKGARAQG